MKKHQHILLQLQLVTMFFLFLSLIMPNVKFYFLLATGYILTIFWLTKSWIKTVVYCYLPLSIYYVGQLYVFRVIQPEELNHPLYPDGRSIYFKFTPLIVFSIAMLVSWIFRLFTERINYSWLIIILLLSVLSREISSIETSVFPWWVQFGNMINDLGKVLWLWWVIDYFFKSSKKEINYFWDYFNRMLQVVIIISSILVIAQGIKGNSLGLVVEQSAILPYSNSGSDSGWLNRPIGIWTHANNASFSIFSFFLAWYLIRLFKYKKIELISQKWLFLPTAAIVWLQSRSVFLAILPILFWWWFFYKKEIIIAITKIKLEIWGWVSGIILLFLSTIVIVDKLWNSLTNFGLYSGWDTRAKLISVALKIINHHFWWGVGVNNFIPVAFREDMSKVMLTFPEAVHNGWILMMAEQGIIGTLIWVIFLLILSKKWWRNSFSLNIKWYLIIIIISQSIVMIFQPFQEILSFGIIVSMLLLANAKYREKKVI